MGSSSNRVAFAGMPGSAWLIHTTTIIILAVTSSVLIPSGALSATVPVTVTVTSVTNASAWDWPTLGDPSGIPDFYARINIDGSSFESGRINNTNSITPGWTFTKDISIRGGRSLVPIRIEILDFNGSIFANDLIDVDPDICAVTFPGMGCTLVTVNRPSADTRGLDVTLDVSTGAFTAFASSGDAAGAAGAGPTCTSGTEGEAATVCFTVAIGPASPETLLVTKTADTNDGSCSLADCSLREAVTAAGNGDTVAIPDLGQPYLLTFRSGSIPPTSPSDEPGHLKITQTNLKIIGPLTGATISQTLPDTRVIDIHGGASVEISNLTVTGGQAGATSTAVVSHLHGGGIHNHGTVKLTNVTISRNTAPKHDMVNGGGGGFYNAGVAEFINVTIAENAAAVRAGGLDGSPQNLANTLIVDNTGPEGNCRVQSINDNGGNLQFPGNACGPAIPAAPAKPIGPLFAAGGKAFYPPLPFRQGGAIDAASNALCPQMDEVGSRRPIDGNHDGNPVCDIGAIEEEFGVIQQPVDPSTGAPGPITIDFTPVTVPGSTILTTMSAGPPPPAGYREGSPRLYYDLRTDVRFTRLEICIAYRGRDFSNEAKVRLFHHIDGAWRDETISVDIAEKVICGRTLSLAMFAIFEQDERRQ